ncbi:DUF2147 domain-containing protein [Hanstruepera ponticola]|uniref:DUF2147 domain-containing protein n=1 Tax=Hanstruepera ponticola TaxID=2042995 RepID=UPI001780EEE0|nr:DUF2147 domain-containing protein [Hanstruepera ponticola]
MGRYFVFFLLFSIKVNSQDIFGKWRTIDDQTHEPKSIVEVYKENGKVYGKIIDIYSESDKNALCKKCQGDDYNQPVVGLVIIKALTKDGKYYKDGTIFDPESGKNYTCRIALNDDNPDILEVRGYISFLYKTQYWERIED